MAKATLYRHFPPKDDLVLAFLRRRDDVWTHGWVEREARSRADDSENQLLAIFDIFDEWFHSEDFEASVFINVLFEMGPSHPTGRATIHYLENIRGVVATMAAEADLREPEAFARSWHLLMQGSIVCAAEGDLEAATRAKRWAARSSSNTGNKTRDQRCGAINRSFGVRERTDPCQGQARVALL